MIYCTAVHFSEFISYIFGSKSIAYSVIIDIMPLVPEVFINKSQIAALCSIVHLECRPFRIAYKIKLGVLQTI